MALMAKHDPPKECHCKRYEARERFMENLVETEKQPTDDQSRNFELVRFFFPSPHLVKFDFLPSYIYIPLRLITPVLYRSSMSSRFLRGVGPII